MLSPFKNWCFWFPYILNFQKKQQRNKKNWFLVNSCLFWFAFHANLMSDGKKKRLKFLFITPLILLINTSISLFRWTLQLIKTYKDNRVTQYNSGEQNNRILSLHRKRKIKHLSFFLRFSIIGINLLIRGSIEVKIR